MMEERALTCRFGQQTPSNALQSRQETEEEEEEGGTQVLRGLTQLSLRLSMQQDRESFELRLQWEVSIFKEDQDPVEDSLNSI